VDNPARQPFEVQVVGGFADGASTTGDIPITTVPAGKRLVIEHVSAFGSMLVDQKLIRASVISPGGKVHHKDIHIQGRKADGSRDYFVVSEAARSYVDPGPVNCFAERDSVAGANPDSVTFTISGYFVDCPDCAL
jgi:hypothetical protein